MEQNEATTATGSTVVAPPPPPPPPPTSQHPQPLSPPQTHPPPQPLLPTQTLLPPKPLPPSPPPSEQNIEVVQVVQLPTQQPPQFTSSQDASSFPVKKRGRPRKYAPDGSLAVPSKPKKPQPLNPMPISASMPVGEFVMTAPMVNHRGRARLGGGGSGGGVRNIEFESPGETAACSSGANFTPHIITVGAGEDVTMKVISFSQQGPRAICILSASGTISNVTIRQPDSSGGTLTYEGRFELLSLSGSFMPSDSGGTRSRSGGMSVSLSSPDGRVVGGSVAGLLVAAAPVQVIVGSFLPSYEIEQKPKKPRYENTPISIPSHGIPMSFTQTDESYSNSSGQGQHQNASMKPSNLSISSSYRGDNNNWSATIHSVSETRSNNGANTDINIPFSAC